MISISDLPGPLFTLSNVKKLATARVPKSGKRVSHYAIVMFKSCLSAMHTLHKAMVANVKKAL